MPTYPHSKRAAIILLFLYENDYFYTNFYQNIHENASFVAYFLMKMKRACKIISLYNSCRHVWCRGKASAL